MLKTIKEQHNIELVRARHSSLATCHTHLLQGKRDSALSEARRLRDEHAQRVDVLETQVQELQRREAYQAQPHVEPTDNESIQNALKTVRTAAYASYFQPSDFLRIPF